MIKKNQQSINSVKEWGKYAGPKEANQWKEYRSAMESAKAWFDNREAQIPAEIKNILAKSPVFESVTISEVEPEKLLDFDDFSGPSHMDVLVKAKDDNGDFIIGIEAKADEPFDKYVKEKFINALEAKVASSNSKRIARIEQLAISMFNERKKDEPRIGELRYQLLTGLAGVIAKANNENYGRAIFLIHEFNTPLTTKEKREQNQTDLNNFIHRLTNGKHQRIEEGNLYGPIEFPGKPLFNKNPELYIGKALRKIKG